jgi:ribosome-binding factor A
MGKSRRESSNGPTRSKRERRTEGGRTLRLCELIREEVNFLLRCEVTDARLQGVTVTYVEMAGECARLWFTAEDKDDKTEALDGAAGFLRSHLAETLALKRTPDLRFRRDPTTRTPVPLEKEDRDHPPAPSPSTNET